jgi:hypothetical protein
MREELDAKLVADYPELYRNRFAPMNQTCMCWGFSCGDGWYQIIDSLSYALTAQHRRAKRDVKFWTERLGKTVWSDRVGTQEDIDKAVKKLEETPCPVADQVKEKFGTLRFYIDRATDAQYNYIEFAELMSSKTCEVCGKPGQTYHMGWHRSLCDEHADENYGEEAAEYRNKTGQWANDEGDDNGLF